MTVSHGALPVFVFDTKQMIMGKAITIDLNPISKRSLVPEISASKIDDVIVYAG